MSGMTIEPMADEDWAAVRAIYEAGIASPNATLEREAPPWGSWHASHLLDCRLVARAPDGSILGWVALTPYSPRVVYRGVAEVSIYVASGARGRGIGRTLLLALIEASEAAGIWTLQAGVLVENEVSLRLHESCGFRRVGVRERIGRDARGRWRDLVLLERRSARIGAEGVAAG